MADEMQEGRGPNWPAENLEAVVQQLRAVNTGVGFGAASREMVANAMGFKTLHGTARRRLAAHGYFGLLERSGATALRISDLGRTLLIPTSDAEYRKALAAAARRPPLYSKLWAKFSGNALPALLSNMLVRDFGLLPQSSEEAAKIFKETAAFAGLLRNGVLYDEPALVDEAAPLPGDRRDGGDQERHEPPMSESGSQVEKPMREALDKADGRRIYTVPLDIDGAVGRLDLPVPLLAEHIEQLESWTKQMLSMVNKKKSDTSVN